MKLDVFGNTVQKQQSKNTEESKFFFFCNTSLLKNIKVSSSLYHHLEELPMNKKDELRNFLSDMESIFFINDLDEIADSGWRKVHISLILQLKDVGSKFLLCGALVEGGICLLYQLDTVLDENMVQEW